MVDGNVNPARAHRRPLEALLSPAARATAVLAAILAASFLGCGGGEGIAGGDGAGVGDEGSDGQGGEDGGGDDVSGDGPPPAADGDYCEASEDCVVVSSTCCACPDFAARADSDYAAACEDVECEEPGECSRVVAACVESRCALVCEPIATTMVCDNGFARDALGCLQDICRADPPDPLIACEGDADCTQAPADCCGCERGGADTAVNVGQVEAFIDSLECRRDPACPGLDVCDASLEPRCFAGACVLAASGGGGGTDDGGDGADGDGDGDGDDGVPEELCGAPEFPPCPTGQVCVLNSQDAEDATRIGVGVCRDA